MTSAWVAGLVRNLSWPLIHGHVSRRLAGVDGLEHVPLTGGMVVVPNHRSYYDHFVMLTVLRVLRPGPIWFVTKSEAFSVTWSRVWHEAWHSIPVDREGPGPGTVRAVRDALVRGEVVCIYPEGTRAPGPELLPFRDGAFRFADLAGAPVVPVALQGTAGIVPRGERRPRDGQFRVSFGLPEQVEPGLPRTVRTERLRDRARASINGHLKRIGCGRTAGAAVSLDTMIEAVLGPEGQLGRADAARLARVSRLTRHLARSEADLDVQRLRISGLRAVTSKGLLRTARTLALGPALRGAARRHPEHALAHYLLGRWELAVPRALGGGMERAQRTLTRASALASPHDTRASAALAELHVRQGEHEAARAALLHVIEFTRPRGRGEHRIARARRALAGLPGPAGAPGTAGVPGTAGAPGTAGTDPASTTHPMKGVA